MKTGLLDPRRTFDLKYISNMAFFWKIADHAYGEVMKLNLWEANTGYVPYFNLNSQKYSL